MIDDNSSTDTAPQFTKQSVSPSSIQTLPNPLKKNGPPCKNLIIWNYKRVESYFIMQIPQCVNWNKIRHFMQSEYTIWETGNKQVTWFVKCTGCQFHWPFLLVEMPNKKKIMKKKNSTNIEKKEIRSVFADTKIMEWLKVHLSCPCLFVSYEKGI